MLRLFQLFKGQIKDQEIKEDAKFKENLYDTVTKSQFGSLDLVISSIETFSKTICSVIPEFCSLKIFLIDESKVIETCIKLKIYSKF